jgi:hypothetical protein
MALGALRPGLVYCPGDWVLQLASMDDFHFSQQRLSGGPATQPPDGQRGPIGLSVPMMTLLAKSTIRPEDAQNPIRHLGLERGFPPSIAVQTAALEFANSVR